LPVSDADTPKNKSSAVTPSLADAEQPIGRGDTGTTAFVGRTLRGPVNTPVTVTSIAEYQQLFGGLWQPSLLSYAVEHYFEQGGQRAVIVRVANGGAPATISLRCGSETLTLEALTPGTREFLRAAIDYDNVDHGLGDHDTECFNLVVQRLRATSSERIEVQETYRRVSVNPGTHRYIGNVLRESQLVRLRGAAPKQRPDQTFAPGSRHIVGYADANNDGDDGAPLSDYDLIGSAAAGTGLFALHAVDNLSFVYIPPLNRDGDLGVSTLVVAERLCRERRAMLIVDPPFTWRSTEQALTGVRKVEFRSAYGVMYFPRIVAFDRLRGRDEVFPNGGAVAGMLARGDELRPVWEMDAPEPEPILRAGARLAVTLIETERWRLASHGINALRTARGSSPLRFLTRTLAGGMNSVADWGYLGQQRLALLIVGSIERGTRWVATSQCDAAVWNRVTRQVAQFLTDLTARGAFPSAPAERAFLAICDERVNSAHDTLDQRVNIVVAFAASRRGRYHSFMITHTVMGSRIKPVAINPAEMPLSIEPTIQWAGDDTAVRPLNVALKVAQIA
jgi:phage tail sheath protein FI